MRKIILAALAVSLFSADSAFGQSFFAMRRSRSLMFVGGTGTSTYFGELANDGDYLQAKLNVTLGLQYYVTRKIGLRADVTWFQLSGSDAKAGSESRKPRNLSFSSNNFEISVVGMYNFYPQGRTFYQRPAFNFYAFGGIGLCYFNPTADYKGTSYSLPSLKTEGVSYSTFTPVIPLGLGVRFKVGPLMNLSFEGGYRFTFTDYLDDVSTSYRDASKFTDPIALALSDRRGEINSTATPIVDGAKRGNPAKNDAYFLFNAKIEYYLPVNFLSGGSRQKTFKKKRKAYYRYNKKGGLRK